MSSSIQLVEIKTVREELGLSQSDIASLIGVSVRTIQACEQGWRNPSPILERQVLLLLISTRQGSEFLKSKCWEEGSCASESCSSCLVKRTRQGHLCWFLTGNNCKGQALKNWAEKKAVCSTCDFFWKLLKVTNPVS